jgi:hypothetical protein
MERRNSALSRFAYLMVVQRGDQDRFRFLNSTFGDREVDVVWDRRVSDRRRSDDGDAPLNRRSSDRRQAPPTSWNNLGFLVARRELDKQEP